MAPRSIAEPSAIPIPTPAPAAAMAEPSQALATADERLKAAGSILGEVAGQLQGISQLIFDAIQQDGNSRDWMLTGAAAMADLAGHLADQAAQAAGGSGVKDAEDWLFSPCALRDMTVLLTRNATTSEGTHV